MFIFDNEQIKMSPIEWKLKRKCLSIILALTFIDLIIQQNVSFHVPPTRQLNYQISKTLWITEKLKLSFFTVFVLDEIGDQLHWINVSYGWIIKTSHRDRISWGSGADWRHVSHLSAGELHFFLFKPKRWGYFHMHIKYSWVEFNLLGIYKSLFLLIFMSCKSIKLRITWNPKLSFHQFSPAAVCREWESYKNKNSSSMSFHCLAIGDRTIRAIQAVSASIK